MAPLPAAAEAALGVSHLTPERIHMSKSLITIALLAIFITPGAFANDPSMPSGGGGTVVKRHKHHKGGEEVVQTEEHRHRVIHFLNEDNRRELLLESIDGGHGHFSKWSPAETKQRMEARAGHLLRKYQQGKLTNNEAAELQMLMNALQ